MSLENPLPGRNTMDELKAAPPLGLCPCGQPATYKYTGTLPHTAACDKWPKCCDPPAPEPTPDAPTGELPRLPRF
jgi:hypothetical protein